MIYCVVEGKTDGAIISSVFKNLGIQSVKIINSNGFPSMPAVARTIMSYMNSDDKVMIICDKDDFRGSDSSTGMYGYLLRGAMYNPSFGLFVFDPNIDCLIVEPVEGSKWKGNKPTEINRMVAEKIDAIKRNDTIKKIMSFIK